VTRQENMMTRYSIVTLNTILGIAAIAILLSNSALQKNVFSNILNFQQLEFCIVITMVCLGLGSLMIPSNQSISAEIAEITSKISEPNSKNAGIEKEIASQLNYIMELLSNHSESTRAFSNTLEGAGRNLVELTSPEQLSLAIGLLVVENNKMHKETSSLQSDLTSAKIQIESLKLNLEVAEETGLRDALTSLWNRRAFDNMLDAQIKIAPNRQLPLCLILADIDHFKSINDRFGHTVGDEIIKLVAGTIAQNVKGKDVAARYGGEEFAIILPETEIGNAITIAEQIKEKLQTLKWASRQNKQNVGSVTASFGVAALKPGEKKNHFIQRTDENLYSAKKSGRNRVVA
jgi:diguanylate cyclase